MESFHSQVQRYQWERGDNGREGRGGQRHTHTHTQHSCVTHKLTLYKIPPDIPGTLDKNRHLSEGTEREREMEETGRVGARGGVTGREIESVLIVVFV